MCRILDRTELKRQARPRKLSARISRFPALWLERAAVATRRCRLRGVRYTTPAVDAIMGGRDVPDSRWLLD